MDRNLVSIAQNFDYIAGNADTLQEVYGIFFNCHKTFKRDLDNIARILPGEVLNHYLELVQMVVPELSDLSLRMPTVRVTGDNEPNHKPLLVHRLRAVRALCDRKVIVGFALAFYAYACDFDIYSAAVDESADTWDKLSEVKLNASSRDMFDGSDFRTCVDSMISDIVSKGRLIDREYSREKLFRVPSHGLIKVLYENFLECHTDYHQVDCMIDRFASCKEDYYCMKDERVSNAYSLMYRVLADRDTLLAHIESLKAIA